jgi:prepilin-type N-terminal cleavage/methylation domain-containing protein
MCKSNQSNKYAIKMLTYLANTRLKNKGFTLIELMIGIAISAIIIIGIAGVYFSVRATQNAQNSVSEIRDSSFIALDRIEYAIKHANYINYSEQRYNINDNKTVPLSSAFLSSGTTNATATNTSDSFTVQMNIPDAASEMVDCAGAAFPTNTVNVKYTTEQKFTISNSSLMCSVKTNSVNVETNSVTAGTYSTPVEIAKGISNMQVFYAVNSSDGCGVSASSNAWKNASEVTTWQDICAVDVVFLATSQTGQLISTNDAIATKVFDLTLNSNINDAIAKAITVSLNGSLLKNTRVVSKVIRLRNYQQ